MHNLHETVALLARTPPALNALLRDLPETWTRRNEGEGTWSPLIIVKHLIHTERSNWMVRVNAILRDGESKVFESLDREGNQHENQDQPLEHWLDEFAGLRGASLDQLRMLNLQPEDLERRGRHPVFGVVTLSQLLATWATHDLTHLHQLSRVMAHQYREAVGPWSVYLGVLQCSGHSSE
jgi:hypothetical protein